jgi:CubicO group peptidase (beta-lactamase class C family)
MHLFRHSSSHRLRRQCPASNASWAFILLWFVLLAVQPVDGRADCMDGRILRLMDRHNVAGLNVLVLRNGREVWASSYGWADPAAQVPMSREVVFRLESLSKPVTAWGVLRMVEQGQIALDAPVDLHLAQWSSPPGTPPLSLRQLLSHSAGVGLGDFTARFPPEGPMPDKRAALSADFTMSSLPGTAFSYSDTGFNLIELLIEDLTAREFVEWMAEEILVPLGMDTAWFGWSPALAGRIATGHDLRGRPVAPYVYPGAASGGLLGDIDSMAAFARASFGELRDDSSEVLSADSIALMHRPAVAVDGLFGLVTEGYGLGHFTETLSDGRRAVWHGGQGYGWMTHLHLVPESGDAIILLANSQRAWPLFAEVLAEWSTTLGVAPVGMARVVQGWTLGVAATTLLTLAAIVQAMRLGIGISSGQRRWTWPTPWRAAAALSGAGLIALALWASAQDYLFLFSILPGLAGWLGLATAALGAVMVLSAFLPRTMVD